MAERLVLDASAALALLRAEPAAGRFREALADARVGEILVPDHFWLEVANVLMRRYGHTPAEVAEALQALDELALVTATVDRPLSLLALEAMAAGHLTAYDAAYLALALVTDAGLVTLDAALAAAAGTRDVFAGAKRGHRSTEIPAPYGPEASLASLAGFGAYLARLRQAWEPESSR